MNYRESYSHTFRGKVALLRHLPLWQSPSYPWKSLLGGAASKPLLRILGAPGTGKRTMAHALATQGGRSAYVVDGHALAQAHLEQLRKDAQALLQSDGLTRLRRVLVIQGMEVEAEDRVVAVAEVAAPYFEQVVVTCDGYFQDHDSTEIDYVLLGIAERRDHLTAVLEELRLKAKLAINETGMAELLRYGWPGELVQLQRVIAVLQAGMWRDVGAMEVEQAIDRSLAPSPYDSVRQWFCGTEPAWYQMAKDGGLRGVTRQFEHALLSTAMLQASNSLTRAAHLLDLPVTTLYSKLKSQGLLSN